jgi:hypothetical protein
MFFFSRYNLAFSSCSLSLFFFDAFPLGEAEESGLGSVLALTKPRAVAMDMSADSRARLTLSRDFRSLLLL